MDKKLIDMSWRAVERYLLYKERVLLLL